MQDEYSQNTHFEQETRLCFTENDKNRWFYNGLNWFHKGIKAILSVVLIFLISSGVVFLFYCFDHSMKPWEGGFKMNRKWGKDGKID